jgi:periplasmic protein TonB
MLVTLAFAATLQAGAASADPALRYYPQAAQAENVEGRATIECNVTAAGVLAACKVLSEEPAGYGFGESALQMAPLFKMRPATRDGVPISGGPIKIPIRFQLPHG